jgi:hypothetical protein
MMPTLGSSAAPVPPPAYHRAQARLGPALHIDALTLVNTLHLLTLCRLAVRLAHHRCPPPLPSLVLAARLEPTVKSLCCSLHFYACFGGFPMSIYATGYVHGPHWTRACGLPLDRDGSPRIPSSSQQCKRGGAPLPEALFVLSVLTAIRCRLIGARDLIIDGAPILAWHRADPDAAYGHAPAQHPRPLLRGYRVHTLICHGSGLPLFFLLSPESAP